MAKRFTDTQKYKKSFYRYLPGAYKLFWDFLYHDCDHAGVWIVDFAIAQQYVGSDMVIDKKTAYDLFNRDEIRIIEFDNGKKWFIHSFITFQYGKLSEKNRAHAAVIQVLKKFNLLDEDLSPITDIPKPLWQQPKGDKDMDKEKEKELDMDKEGDARGILTLPLNQVRLCPEMVNIFVQAYPDYPSDNKEDLPACLEIAKKIAKTKKWTIESVTNGRMNDVLLAWRTIVTFSKSDKWFCTRAISDFDKEYQRLIQKMNHGKNSSGNTGIKQTGQVVPAGNFGKL